MRDCLLIFIHQHIQITFIAEDTSLWVVTQCHHLNLQQHNFENLPSHFPSRSNVYESKL
jgi:hypothetical protein